MSEGIALSLLVVAGLVQVAAKKNWLPRWLDPVILAYAIGLLAGNVGLGLDSKTPLGEGVLTAAVLLGIPLLLFPADFLAWLRLAPRTAKATGLAFGVVALTSIASGLFFAPRVGEEGWIVAGMLTGTFTGSAPNLLAVGQALGASPDTVALVGTTDFVVAGAFCFVLLSPAVNVLLRWLPAFEPSGKQSTDDESESGGDAPGEASPGVDTNAERAPIRALDWLAAAGLGLLVAGIAGGSALLLPTRFQQLGAILGVTTLGVLASLSAPIRRLRASPLLGEYWILVFCLAFGSLANLARIWTGLTWVLAWTVCVLALAVAIHWLLCRPLGIDRDTAIITVAAAIFGPALIPAVAANLKNRELVLSGVTAALAGLALGSYLGVFVSYAVRALTS
ncbi:MAG: DUF819 family protein [Planctomycetes bacterium]|nr:DUF819 family protein [Planctomycetota bacterium]